MAYVVMAHALMAYVVMAYVFMSHALTAYVVMAWSKRSTLDCLVCHWVQSPNADGHNWNGCHWQCRWSVLSGPFFLIDDGADGRGWWPFAIWGPPRFATHRPTAGVFTQSCVFSFFLGMGHMPGRMPVCMCMHMCTYTCKHH